MNEDRLTELEIKQAYQEDLVQSLNQIVSQQQIQIQRLEATCQVLYQRLQALAEVNSLASNEPPPPHY